MTTRDLLIVYSTPGLAEIIQSSYDGINVITSGNLAFAEGMLEGRQLPHAIYVEDIVPYLNLAALRRFIDTALRKRIAVYVGLQSIGRTVAHEFEHAGVPVTQERDAAAIAAWLVPQVGGKKRQVGRQSIFGISSAKGGVGKTLVASMLAEGLHRRGLKVLLVDCDLSNTGIVPAFCIPSGFPSYLQLLQDRVPAWSAEALRRLIYRHKNGIHFLLGSDHTKDRLDFHHEEWLALFNAVRGLDEYDVIIFDTGPELKRRPYSLDIAEARGYVILPSPPGLKERSGMWNALEFFESEHQLVDLTSRCFLLPIEAERGSVVSVSKMLPMFKERFKKLRVLPTLPRAARQISQADEASAEDYLCPLDADPASAFSRAVHTIVDNLCKEAGITPPLPRPGFSFWQRWRRRTPGTASSEPAVIAQEAK